MENIERPIHELLTIIRDNANVNSNELIKSGLCYEVSKLHSNNLISVYERMSLDKFIEEHMPTYVIPERFTKYSDYNSHGFGWLPRKWKPRLKWLNKQIELTTPKQ